MKTINLTLCTLLLMVVLPSMSYAQTETPVRQKYVYRLLTVEPGIGVHTNMGMDLVLSALVQWNPQRKLAFTAQSVYSMNNVTAREVNYVTTDYNYSLGQRFGIGTTLYAKRSSHSFFLMGGVSYTAYRETLNHPLLSGASIAIDALSPDYGILYSLKKGGKNCFFTFRAYLPLYPWPMKGPDINYVDANLSTISLEFGVGVRIK